MHLYLHVPFCVRRCSYCDFSIAVRQWIPAREYVATVLAELRSADPGPLARSGSSLVQPGATPRGQPLELLDTIYLGGGTPSLLPPEATAALLHDLALHFHSPRSAIRNEIEVTLEANPEDVAAERAAAWCAAGVNRVSLGAQSFDDRVLKWMHRSHDAARIGAAVATLREAGITNISLDLIFGLPEELERDWGRDLEQAVSLSPFHLSLYGLTVEPRTPLDRWISRGATRAPEESRYADEYLLAHQRLSAAGYQFYEVSNAAREGYRSRHNSAYWAGSRYLGLGPAAHSFDGRVRRWNLSAWEAYRRAIAEGRSPMESEETLTAAQRDLERLYLALRTSAGVDRSVVPSFHLSPWVAAGWVEEAGGRVRCTPEGWLRLDELVSKLFAVKGLTPS